MTTQTDIHMPADVNANDLGTNNVNAHMPPQPVPAATTVPGVRWIPQTNEWAPSNEPVGAGDAELANQEPSHGDVTPAHPMSRAPGQPDTGSQDSPRMNLLDAVRQPAQSTPLPTQRVEHVITTQDEGTDVVRTRTVRVQGTTPTVLLEENPYRTLAYLKLVTTGGVITVYPLRQGGAGVSSTGVPTAPNAGYMIATGDPVHKSESKAGIEAIVEDTGSSSFCDVTVWEELNVPGDKPGIGV